MTHPGSPSTHGADATESTRTRADLSPGSAGEQKVVLLPCRTAPSRDRVQLWLQSRREFQHVHRENRKTALEDLAVSHQDQNERISRTADCAEECKEQSTMNQEDTSERATSPQPLKKRGMDLCLKISPLEVKSHHTPKKHGIGATPRAREGTVKEEDDDQYSGQSSSPDVPDLPPWQKSAWPCSAAGQPVEELEKEFMPELLLQRLTGSGDPLYPSPESRQDILPCPSPFTFTAQGGETVSPILLHSTPVIQRRRSKGDSEPICSTPVIEGNGFFLMF